MTFKGIEDRIKNIVRTANDNGELIGIKMISEQIRETSSRTVYRIVDQMVCDGELFDDYIRKNGCVFRMIYATDPHIGCKHKRGCA